MRAAGQNPLLAAQRGVKLHGVYALAWSLSTFTGGLAGMLIALNSGLTGTMVIIGLKAFPAALVGGQKRQGARPAGMRTLLSPEERTAIVEVRLFSLTIGIGCEPIHSGLKAMLLALSCACATIFRSGDQGRRINREAAMSLDSTDFEDDRHSETPASTRASRRH